MASGKQISPRKWDFARRRLYGNTSGRISIADGLGPTSGSVRPFMGWQPPANTSPQPATGSTGKRAGRRSGRGRAVRRRFPILWWHATRRPHEDPAQRAAVDRLPVRSAVSGAGRGPAVRQDVSGAGGTVPGGLGSRPPGVVRRSHVQTGETNRLEGAQKDDAILLGGAPERNRPSDRAGLRGHDLPARRR